MHEFISNQPDTGGERISAGYPDECLDFTTFAGSLAALVTDGEWLIQPFTQKRLAVIVDFASDNAGGGRSESELRLERGPAVPHRLREHRALANRDKRAECQDRATSLTDCYRRYHARILLEHHGKTFGCPLMQRPQCRTCQGRFPRDLSLAMTIFADWGRFATVYLFSRWQPSDELRALLRTDEIEIQWNPLSAIPRADLEANRYYSIWDGPRKQYDDFVARFWAPSWQRSREAPASHREPNAASKIREGRLNVHMPVANPAWRSLKDMQFVAFYAMKAPEFSEADRNTFVKEANRLCLLLLRKVRGVTADPGEFTWLLLPADIEAMASRQGFDATSTSWAVAVHADFDPDDEIGKSLYEAWAPRLDAALRFAMPVEPSAAHDILEGSPEECITLTHDTENPER